MNEQTIEHEHDGEVAEGDRKQSWGTLGTAEAGVSLRAMLATLEAIPLVAVLGAGALSAVGVAIERLGEDLRARRRELPHLLDLAARAKALDVAWELLEEDERIADDLAELSDLAVVVRERAMACNDQAVPWVIDVLKAGAALMDATEVGQ
jgi:hypothetical protein